MARSLSNNCTRPLKSGWSELVLIMVNMAFSGSDPAKIYNIYHIINNERGPEQKISHHKITIAIYGCQYKKKKQKNKPVFSYMITKFDTIFNYALRIV